MDVTLNTDARSRAAIQSSIARLAVAWQSGSGAQWGAEFWPDATMVNILGAYFSGASAIAAVHEKIFAGPFKGSTIALDLREIRFLGSAAAIVRVTTNVVDFAGLPPGAVATSTNLLETSFLFVYENRAGTWKIGAAQNTAVLPGTIAQTSATGT